MDKRTWDGASSLAFGIILIFVGLQLLYQAHQAGPAGPVMLKLSRGAPTAVSVQTVIKIGIGLTLSGAASTAFAFRQGIQVFGTSRPLPRWPIVAGMFLFIVLMIAFWDFLLRTIQ